MEMEMEMKLMKYFCEHLELSHRSCSVVVAQHTNCLVFVSINEYCQLKKTSCTDRACKEIETLKQKPIHDVIAFSYDVVASAECIKKQTKEIAPVLVPKKLNKGQRRTELARGDVITATAFCQRGDQR